MANSISRQTLQRLPVYLNYLKGLQDRSGYISASSIASALNLNDVQVRKDLAMITSSGRPKIGYPVGYLIDDLEVYLGYRYVSSAVLVGAGHLGKALLNYSGFKTYGLEILAAFDVNENVVARGNGSIMNLDQLSEFCRCNNPRIGIITVPAN
ncbi:redox-sensing transcriptional repressor Rex, partial [bacterium]|nr:redox-sensing transcriptional repressor Rex [bacterium]